MALVDEKLLEVTEKNLKLEQTIKDMTLEAEEVQLDVVQKIAKAKIEFETKEIELKKQIKDLTLSLELRNSNERTIAKKKGKKSVNQIWEEVTGETK